MLRSYSLVLFGSGAAVAHAAVYLVTREVPPKFSRAKAERHAHIRDQSQL
jgi:hypothetical protein